MPEGEDSQQEGLAALGLYVAQFSRLVLVMRRAMQERLAPAERHLAEIAFGEMTAQPIANSFFAMCAAATDLDADERKIVVSLKREVDDSIKTRNDIAHGDWWLSWADEAQTSIDMYLRRIKPTRRSGARVNRRFEPTELHDLSQALAVLRHRVGGLGQLCLGVPFIGLEPRRVRDVYELRDKKVFVTEGAAKFGDEWIIFA